MNQESPGPENDTSDLLYELYPQLTSNSSTQPKLSLCINGDFMSFLVDTGADISTMGKQDSDKFAMYGSNKTVHVTGASGQFTSETMSTPLTVRYENSILQHSFLLSKVCPENLLGRDLLCKLNLTITLTTGGVGLEGPIVLFCQKICPTWIGYECMSPNSVFETPVPTQGDIQTPECFRCVLTDFTETPTPGYLEKWYQVGQRVDSIKIVGIITCKHWSAVVVDLPSELKKLVSSDDSYPHVALAKTKGEWSV